MIFLRTRRGDEDGMRVLVGPGVEDETEVYIPSVVLGTR
jgi:hypothetical protein